MSTKSNRLKIALQKSGRLSEASFDFLKACGIEINRGDGQLFCQSDSFPLDILLVRDDDIPYLLQNGICDLGIVGANVWSEKSCLTKDLIATVDQVSLNFGQCRLSIAVPKDFLYKGPNSLSGKRLATTYPCLLQEFLNNEQITSEIIQLNGAVEIAPALGIADGICDLVSSGATLMANGLKEVEVIFKSTALFIKSNNQLSNEKQIVFEEFRRRMERLS